ncbi:MAG: HAD family phosphatase [Deltaproteobacteria bacterium]|nr:HAD family phosphatase [Deltaproteobacteria bacterium]
MRSGPAVVLMLCLLLPACSSLPKFPAVYLDMDGTVLGPDHRVRPATVEALEEYRRCGGRVGIATGRSLVQVREYLADVRPNLPLVLFNGAAIFSHDGSEVIESFLLAPEIIRDVASAARTSPDVQGVVVQGLEVTLLDRDDEQVRRLMEKGSLPPDRIVESVDELAVANAVKVMLFVQADRIDAVRDRIAARVAGRANTVVSSPLTIEILPFGVTKGDSVNRALGLVGIDASDAVRFGDSGNDVEMLAGPGPGFAMGNCRPEACKAALLTIGKNDSDAIADVIRKVVSGPGCPR